MTPESDQKIPPLSNEAGRLWRSQQAPADILRRLRESPLPDESPTSEDAHRRHAVFAMAIALGLFLFLVWQNDAEEQLVTGLRLDLHSGRLHVVWVQSNSREALP